MKKNKNFLERMESGSFLPVDKSLEIGQKVKWISGNVECKGVVLECKGSLTDVVIHYIGTRASGTNLEVLTSVLEKY